MGQGKRSLFKGLCLTTYGHARGRALSYWGILTGFTTGVLSGPTGDGLHCGLDTGGQTPPSE